MIVCICRGVSDHQIRRAAAEGATSLECLQFELGVATQCGRCADCASRVLCDARADARAEAAPQGMSVIRIQRAEQMA